MGRRWLYRSRQLGLFNCNHEAGVQCYTPGLVYRSVVLDWLSVVYIRLNQLLALDGSLTMMIQH